MGVKSMKNLLTAEQVSEILAVRPRTVLTMAGRGEIPCMRVNGRVVRFDPDRIARWVEDRHRDEAKLVRKRGA